MMAPILLFLAAITIKPGGAPLHEGCSAEDAVVASLPAGTLVEIRFALSDGSNCYKIAASVDGKAVLGYVPESALAGLDGFQRERAGAASVESIKASELIHARTSDPVLTRALQLLNANQPAQALEILEPMVKVHKQNASVLLLAGLAAYRSDRMADALDYWKQSLDIESNEALARLYAKARREAVGDKSGEKIYGMRVVLRYEGEALPADTARGIVAMLDSEFTRIAGQLGCSTEERVVAIVQSREAFLKSTGAAEWTGGQYDGRIRISLAGQQAAGPEVRRTAAHEIVHACLANISSGSLPWPAWLQEGLAQKLSGDTLSAADRAQLRVLAEEHAIPRLENLTQDWSRMSAERARIAYGMALAATSLIDPGNLRNILNNPQTLQQVTTDLDKQLGL